MTFLVDSGAVYSVVPAATLESLGLILDPMKRVLRPLPMVLGQVRGGIAVPGPRLVRVGKRLVARPSAPSKARSAVNVAALVERHRGR